MQCPSCKTEQLNLVKTEFGTNLICFKCSGHLGSLRYFITNGGKLGYSVSEKVKETEKSLPCPKCRQDFEKRTVTGNGLELIVDLCYQCSLVWYDRTELEALFVQIAKYRAQAINSNNIVPNKISRAVKNSDNAKGQDASLIKLIHETKYLTGTDKAAVIDFLANGPKKTPEKKPSDVCMGIFDIDIDIDFPDFGDF